MQLHLSVAAGEGPDAQVLSHCTICLPDNPDIATLGLSLADGKSVLSWLQTVLVTRQISEHCHLQRACQHCGAARRVKDCHSVRYRSLFGDVTSRVARWCVCKCGAPVEPAATRHRWISAEREYVHSQLAATLPYARACELLSLLLQHGMGAATSAVRAHALATGQRLLAEAPMAVESDRVEPGATVAATVATNVAMGLDSGYMRHCKPDPETNFEVVAGRRLQPGRRSRSLAFVRIAETDVMRRVAAVAAGVDEVVTDGATQLRKWQMSALPEATHILDWYHLRRRVEQLDRVIHGKPVAKQLRARDHDRLSRLADHLKWRLWHGRTADAIRRLQVVLRVLQRPAVKVKAAASPVRKLATELLQYLQNNADSLPDYVQRWRSGQRISSAFIESAVIQIIDKRMSKSQKMRWDPPSAHRLLQVRVRHIDGLLRSDFAHWYPGFPANETRMTVATCPQQTNRSPLRAGVNLHF